MALFVLSSSIILPYWGIAVLLVVCVLLLNLRNKHDFSFIAVWILGLACLLFAGLGALLKWLTPWDEMFNTWFQNTVLQ